MQVPRELRGSTVKLSSKCDIDTGDSRMKWRTWRMWYIYKNRETEESMGLWGIKKVNMEKKKSIWLEDDAKKSFGCQLLGTQLRTGDVVTRVILHNF